MYNLWTLVDLIGHLLFICIELDTAMKLHDTLCPDNLRELHLQLEGLFCFFCCNVLCYWLKQTYIYISIHIHLHSTISTLLFSHSLNLIMPAFFLAKLAQCKRLWREHFSKPEFGFQDWMPSHPPLLPSYAFSLSLFVLLNEPLSFCL